LFGQYKRRPLVCLGGDLRCSVTDVQHSHLGVAPS
jgi:hypothetical protein